MDLTASPSVLTRRSSASGDLKPFSEEKGIKTSKQTLRLRVLGTGTAKRKGCSVTLLDCFKRFAKRVH
ncbi:MAG: hypothetical protein MSR67_10315, partial [Oscillospiraceae bacterium]|nr:hypothetical protein [Oscillospiraceae bacterium]